MGQSELTEHQGQLLGIKRKRARLEGILPTREKQCCSHALAELQAAAATAVDMGQLGSKGDVPYVFQFADASVGHENSEEGSMQNSVKKASIRKRGSARSAKQLESVPRLIDLTTSTDVTRVVPVLASSMDMSHHTQHRSAASSRRRRSSGNGNNKSQRALILEATGKAYKGRAHRKATTSRIGWISTDIILGRGADMSKFSCQLVLGSGLMGTIRLAKCKIDNKYVALKCVRKDYVCKHDAMKHLLGEKRALTALDHCFIIDCFGAFQQTRWLVFALEYVPGGELYRRLLSVGHFSEDAAKFYSVEVFSALEYIHQSGFVYRDLKPENLLIDELGHIKMCDFGFCITPPEDGRCHSNVGTPCYLSPEQLNGHKTDGYLADVVDWWAFGCVIYELLVGRTPFESSGGKNAGDETRYEIYLRVLKGKIRWPHQVPSAIKEVVGQLLNPDIDRRTYHAHKLKKCKWFEGVDWDRVALRELVPPWRPTLSSIGDHKYYEEHPDVGDAEIDESLIQQAYCAEFG